MLKLTRSASNVQNLEHSRLQRERFWFNMRMIATLNWVDDMHDQINLNIFTTRSPDALDGYHIPGRCGSECGNATRNFTWSGLNRRCDHRWVHVLDENIEDLCKPTRCAQDQVRGARRSCSGVRQRAAERFEICNSQPRQHPLFVF